MTVDEVEVTVGLVGRAHGVRGEVNIEVRTDEVERRFASGAVLYTEATNTAAVRTYERAGFAPSRIDVQYR